MAIGGYEKNPIIWDKIDENFAPYYPIGQNLLLFPFIFLGLKSIFLFGLVFHLINVLVIAKVLVKLKIKPIYSILYLFYPGLVFYSRTIMTEVSSITFILLGLYYYILANENKNKQGYEKKNIIGIEKNSIYSGIFFSISCMIRYTNVLFFGPFLIVSLFKNRKRFYNLILGFVPIAIIIFLLNFFIYGNLFSTGYGNMINLNRGIVQISKTFIYYIIIFLIVYPGLLISPITYKKKLKLEIIILVALLFPAFSYLNPKIFHYDFIRNLLIGARYLFPLVPFLIIPYSSLIEKIIKRFKLNYKVLMLIIIIILCFSTICLSKIQNDYTNNLYGVASNIHKRIEEDTIVIGDGFNLIYFNEYLGNKKFINYNEPTWIDYLELAGKPDYGLFANHKPDDSYVSKDFSEFENKILNKYKHSILYEANEPYLLRIYKLE